jgi:sRNA-binding carbon storage regulator CsrA
MLVLSRKKTECIVIDGTIQVEVVSHLKGLVYIKLLTPRALSVTLGPKREPRDGFATQPPPKPINGHDQLNLAIAIRDVVRLGDRISLGVVDADATRVLFVVDAPPGTKIRAVGKLELEPDVRSTGQSLLQFMEPGEKLKRDQDAENSAHDGKRNGTPSTGFKGWSDNRPLKRRPARPNLLPFPSLGLPAEKPIPKISSERSAKGPDALIPPKRADDASRNDGEGSSKDD